MFAIIYSIFHFALLTSKIVQTNIQIFLKYMLKFYKATWSLKENKKINYMPKGSEMWISLTSWKYLNYTLKQCWLMVYYCNITL